MIRARRPSPAASAPAPAQPDDRRPQGEEDPLVPVNLVFGHRVVTILCPASEVEAARVRRDGKGR